MASFRCGFWARYLSVTSGSPSRIMRCTIIKLLKTMVHVESRRRLVRARKISATPASPACVATRICSTYLDFGAASCAYELVNRSVRAKLSAAYLYFRRALDTLLERARHACGLAQLLVIKCCGRRCRRIAMIAGSGWAGCWSCSGALRQHHIEREQ